MKMNRVNAYKWTTMKCIQRIQITNDYIDRNIIYIYLYYERLGSYQYFLHFYWVKTNKLDVFRTGIYNIKWVSP